jgi:AcrR family transcriptional regulator
MNDLTMSRGAGNTALRPDVTGGILESVLTELAEVGYGRLSMDSVARRAGSGKSALYRRWQSKEEMVLDALASISTPSPKRDTSTGLREDIREAVYGVNEWLSDARMSRIMPDLLAEAKRNPDLATALDRLAGNRRQHALSIINAAVARGDVAVDADIEYAIDLMAGPIFWRICGLRKETNVPFLDKVVDTILHTLGASVR